MRITSILSTVALVASLAAPPAAAQERPRGEHGAGLSPPPETLSPHTRAAGRSVERLREQIHETNRWMIVHGSPEGLHGVGTELAHAGEHLQELIRRLDDAYRDRDISTNPESRRRVEAVGEQVRELARQMGRTLAVLRQAVGQR